MEVSGYQVVCLYKKTYSIVDDSAIEDFSNAILVKAS